MKFYAIYICPMCNQRFRISDQPFEMEREDAPELVAKIVQNQRMLGNPYLYKAPMHVPHDCTNGCIGIARLSGFSPAEVPIIYEEDKHERKGFLGISRKQNQAK